MNRYVILRHFRKQVYFSLISNPTAKENYSRFFDIFFIFINRLKIIRPSRQKYKYITNFKAFEKTGLLPIAISILSSKKLYSIFRYFSLFFLTDSILSDQADKNMSRYVILRHFRKWIYFPMISNPIAEKKNSRFYDIILYFY